MRSPQVSYKAGLLALKCLGLFPNNLSSPDLALSRPYALLVVFLLVLYWTGLVSFVWIPHGTKGSNPISKVSNWLQLLANAVTLSVAVTLPILSHSTLPRIIELYEKSAQLLSLKDWGRDDGKLRRRCVLIGGGFLVYNTYLVSYDFYISFYKLQLMTFGYWSVTFIPLFVYSFAVCSALCFLNVLYEQFLRLNWLLDQSSVLFVIPGEKSRKESLTMLLHALQTLQDLAKVVEKYFALLFLAVFTSIFIVTTIQIYYCYTQFAGTPENELVDVRLIFLCVNVMAFNAAMIFLIVSICEAIVGQSSTSCYLFSKLKVSGSRNCSSEEVVQLCQVFSCTNIVVSFSAYGFFGVSFSTMCQFIGGVTTYLIIYIQFYGLYTDESSSPQPTKIQNTKSM